MKSVTKDNWYLFDEINKIDSPALIIYVDRVKENIHTLISMIDDVQRLRPHAKTHKSVDVTQLLIKAGIQKFKCATIAEAEMLAMTKAKDVLLAYQPVGPKLDRFIQLIKKYPATKFSCLIDNILTAQSVAEAFAFHNLNVGIYIDLNVGQNRTGIIPGPNAVELYIECSKMKGIKPIGLHPYDGNLHDADFNVRKQKCDEAFAVVEKLRDDLSSKGFAEPIIVAGGSPTFPIHAKRKNIECSPGTFIYWDKGYLEKCSEQNFLPAALLLTRVVSFPTETKICLDLGHKSVAAENEISKRVYFLNAPELKFISQSEEHLVTETEKSNSYKPGDTLFGIPYHICPTVALYEKIYTIENGKLSGEWDVTARGRKITI